MEKRDHVIAIDFDGTLCVSAYPDIGEPKEEVIEAAKKEKENGAYLVLWTCREGNLLEDALAWCLEHGLEFDYVNDNPLHRIQCYGTNCRKVFCDELWDDTCVHPDNIAHRVPIHRNPFEVFFGCSNCGSSKIGKYCADCGKRII